MSLVAAAFGGTDLEYVEKAQAFAREVIAPHFRLYDDSNDFAAEIHRQAHDWGLMNAGLPVELGGRGVSCRAMVAGGVAMATVCAPATFSLGYNNGALRPLLIAGSQAQKLAFVKPLVDDQGYASWCMTEEDVAGSNLFAVKTRARRVPGGWVLNGHKVMAGNGTVASLFLVLADCWHDGRSVGLSVFCVPRGDGVIVGQNTDKLGFRCLTTPDVRFEDVFVDDGHMLGAPGSAVSLILDSLDYMRLGGGMVTVGLTKGALDDVAPWLKERRVYGGQRLADQSHVQVELGGIVAQLIAVETLLEKVAAQLDRGVVRKQQTAALKLLGSQLAIRSTETVAQLFGWRGIDARYGIQKRCRDARQTSIYEGANEVLAMNLYRWYVVGAGPTFGQVGRDRAERRSDHVRLQ